MSADGETPSPERGKRRLLVDELAALLDSLRTLYTQISAKLWHRRMQPPAPSAMAGESADIAGSLNGHIERAASEARVSSEASPGADSSMERSGQSVVGRENPLQIPGLRLFSGLARYFRRRGGSAGYQRLGEKMRANTTRHINQALRLAKRGDARGAKVRAELAESAMKTASQYLPEEEYRTFKQHVESRLEEIVGR
jgi:hypothetical protein